MIYDGFFVMVWLWNSWEEYLAVVHPCSVSSCPRFFKLLNLLTPAALGIGRIAPPVRRTVKEATAGTVIFLMHDQRGQ